MSKIFSITAGLENLGALRTGGQGSVYKGRRMGPVISAVKLLPTPIHSENDEDKNFRNFQNEVAKLKKVNEDPNPNVVKILASGLTESGSLPYIEMEFIEGPDLEDLLKPPHEAIFTIKETIKLADHLANALAHCHRVGVKHGDVKSNNVKYNVNSGNYMLLDFGLSIMSDEQRRTSIRHAGAIEFMAPEQNEGIMLFQTDVYSYGIILYELLAGRPPFPLHDNGETSRNAVMIAHMESPVPDLLALRKNKLPQGWSQERKDQEMRIPQWLLQVIINCLQKKPENRFRNGMELQNALAEGSMEYGMPHVSGDDMLVLHAENERLAAELQTFKLLYENSKDKVHISKSRFGLLMIILVLLLAFGSYGTFGNHTTSLPKGDTVATVPGFPVPKKAVVPNPDQPIVHRLADTTDSSRLANKKQLAADSVKKAAAHSHKKKRKPKRKKFLGIF